MRSGIDSILVCLSKTDVDSNFYSGCSCVMVWHLTIFWKVLSMVFGPGLYRITLYVGRHRSKNIWSNVASGDEKSVAITLGMVYLSWVALDYHYHLTHIMFASNCFEPLWLFLLVALVGVMALAGIVSHLPNFSWLTALGRNTLVFYFFSNQVIMLVFSQVEKLQIGNYYISSWLVAAVSSLLLAIPVVVCNKYLPWMAGKCTIISKRYSL